MSQLFLSFLAILTHEAGHIIVAKLVGVPRPELSVNPIGITMHFDFSRVGYLREAAVHAGGPAVGMLGAIISILMFGENCITFCGISAVLSVVNLLPIRGFDGGGILSCALSPLFLPDTAEKISRAISLVFLVLLWAAVLWIELRVGANLSLLAFVLFFILKVV